MAASEPLEARLAAASATLKKYALHDACDMLCHCDGSAEGVPGCEHELSRLLDLLGAALSTPPPPLQSLDVMSRMGGVTQPRSSAETVLALLDVNERDDSGCSPLHVALLNASAACAQRLLNAGARLNLKCNGSPPLHVLLHLLDLPSVAQRALSTWQWMLTLDTCDLNATDDAGRAPLQVAAGVGSLPAIQRLADRYDRDAADARRMAAALGGSATVSIPSMDLNAADKYGRTALHAAAASGSLPVLTWVLTRGADVHAVDARGDSAAHVAARNGWREGMAALHAHGAAPERLNWHGVTPDAAFVGHAAGEGRRTLIITHAACVAHRTCAPITRAVKYIPPENTERLATLLSTRYGTLQSERIASACEVVYGAPAAQMSDVLRVHEYDYIRRVTTAVASANGDEVKLLDGDTAVCKESWEAALRAAGAVCAAVDDVIAGGHRNAFAVVRPPGHHAGPSGIVTNGNDCDGSHGFCLLNNVAIAAAYARAVHGREAYGAPSAGAPAPRVRRIAIFDFDVHHGNGTEAIVRNLYPTEVVETFTHTYMRGVHSHMSYKPWLAADDGNDVLFISSHGYGSRNPSNVEGVPRGWFYPGSGASTGWCAEMEASLAADTVSEHTLACAHGHVHDVSAPPAGPVTRHGTPAPLSLEPMLVPEPLHEAHARMPHIINIGMAPGTSARVWRRIMTADILPRLDAFKPDIILVSAGFDAHHKDVINCGYMGLREDDYEWITAQLVKISNNHCPGRIVSVLEGGYRIQGRVVSAFGRSVAAHVRALSSGSEEKWDTVTERQRLVSEIAAEREYTRQQAEAEAARLTARLAASTARKAARAQPAGSPLPSPAVDTPATSRTEAAFAMPPPVLTAAGSADSIPATPAAASASSEGDGDASARRKRRRSAAGVDYVALDAQLRLEALQQSGQLRDVKVARVDDGATAVATVTSTEESQIQGAGTIDS